MLYFVLQPEPVTGRHTIGISAFFAGLVLTAFSMPLSNVGMSVGQFLLAGGWLLSDDLIGRLKRAAREPLWWMLMGLYGWHLAGLWNTEDFTFALKDLRVKLPLLILPLVTGSGPLLTARQIRQIMAALLAGVLAATVTGYMHYLTQPLAVQLDYRSLSLYISHIRLSLLIDVSILIAVFFIRGKSNLWLKIVLTAAIVWMLYFLMMLQSVTGLGILGVLLLAAMLAMLFRPVPTLLRLLAALILAAGIYASYRLYDYVFVESLKPVPYDRASSPTHTPRGHAYQYDLSRQAVENGRLVWVEYCEQELDSAWKIRSRQGLWGEDRRGHMQLMTLMRYLTFKGYRKDADGIARLSKQEVEEIEQGYATPEEARTGHGPGYRLRLLAAEYRQYHYEGWAAGHSLAQRLEFAKAAGHIIRQHPLTGVGTGDPPKAFAKAYEDLRTMLPPQWRLRAHNQYLSMAVAFGWPGLSFFVITLAGCLAVALKRKDVFYTAFLIIASISFINEDTLETQAGVTFFAFLNCFFLFVRWAGRAQGERI